MTTRKVKPIPWNKDRAQGESAPFTLAQIAILESHLLNQESDHDLALLAFGLGSLLRSSDILRRQVREVLYPNGQFRTRIPIQQRKTKRQVKIAFSKEQQSHILYWIKVSGKRPEDYIFTRTKDPHGPPISRWAHAEVVKGWAHVLGLPPEEFSTHSLRRSKAVHLYEAGEDIVAISKLLGHKSIAVTTSYLGIDQRQAEAANLRHPMMKGRPDG